VSTADRQLQEKIRALHIGDAKPVVRHLLGPET
jgi:hypothetical protein